MRHPFELEFSKLKTLNWQIPELTDGEAEKVAGGKVQQASLKDYEDGGNEPKFFEDYTASLGNECGEDQPFDIASVPDAECGDDLPTYYF